MRLLVLSPDLPFTCVQVGSWFTLIGDLLASLSVQVDRSPTGSGVTARVAVQFHKKQIKLGKIISV